MKNIFACLVHEKPECVLDLVRNLRCLDPASHILLYNGGKDADLLKDYPFERFGAVVHPNPRPMKWGWLHDFALDCMRFSLENLEFDTMTIVDSDQLMIGKNYSAFLSKCLEDKENVGMLITEPERQGADTTIPPAKTAYEEIELWRPFLRKFEKGEEKFLYWTFWPATVFTREVAVALLDLFDNDEQLRGILERTNIWASEEILFPTLTALLRFELLANPCENEFVQYKKFYTHPQLVKALSSAGEFWMHPVARQKGDVTRNIIRAYFDNYKTPFSMKKHEEIVGVDNGTPFLLPSNIAQKVKDIDGWLEDEELELLIVAAGQALGNQPHLHNIVEVGSYCGRSTVALALVARNMSADAKVYAIDPHEGIVGADGQKLNKTFPTLESFHRNIEAYGVTETVEMIQKFSYKVEWNKPISFLLVDGLHDYFNVSRDFFHFEEYLVPGGYIAFHDYADYYPGVKVFVDELLESQGFAKVEQAGSMMLLRKVTGALPETKEQKRNEAEVNRENASENVLKKAGNPPVSCIMPTADRPGFVTQSVERFLSQDYERRELIIVDDGIEAVQDRIPEDPRIRYFRLEGKRTVGWKRNFACREAKGAIIVHWDDDDWMADGWITAQITALLTSKAGITGLNAVYFFDPEQERAWQYVYPKGEKPWVHGATLCYWREVWETSPFLDVNVGEDVRFIWNNLDKKVVPHNEGELYVGTVHRGNTSPKRTADKRWKPVCVEELGCTEGLVSTE